MTDAMKAQSTAQAEGVGSHTPTPWYPNTSHGPKTYVWADVDDEPVLVAVCRSRDAMVPNPAGAPARVAEANVSHIVRACNAHDELVEALEGLVEIVDAAGLLHLSNGVQLGQTSWYVKATDRMEAARAALARARGETP